MQVYRESHGRLYPKLIFLIAEKNDWKNLRFSFNRFFAGAKTSFKSKKIALPCGPVAYALLVEFLLYSPTYLELW